MVFALPPVQMATDHAPAVSAVIEAMARGDLTPSEGHAFVSLIDQHRRALELSELESRVAALEAI